MHGFWLEEHEAQGMQVDDADDDDDEASDEVIEPSHEASEARDEASEASNDGDAFGDDAHEDDDDGSNHNFTAARPVSLVESESEDDDDGSNHNFAADRPISLVESEEEAEARMASSVDASRDAKARVLESNTDLRLQHQCLVVELKVVTEAEHTAHAASNHKSCWTNIGNISATSLAWGI
jgi:hypothetical protein